MSESTLPLARGSLLPLSAMLLLFLCADFFGMYFLQSTALQVFFFCGVYQAQAGIFCILAGAVGRSWIFSFLLSAVLSVSAILLFYCGDLWSIDLPWAEISMLACGVVPLFLFCGCIPFLVLRSFFGWHLTRSTFESEQPYSLRIEDFFLAMVVVAGLLAAAPAAIGFAIGGGFAGDWTVIPIAAVLSMVASAIAVVPVCMVYFRTSTRHGRTAVLFLFAFLGLATATAIQLGIQLWNGASLGSALVGSITTLLYLTTSSVLFSIGLVVLHWSGFRLQSIAKARESTDATDPLTDSPSLATSSSYRKKNRIAAAGLVVGSIAISLCISYFTNERLKLTETYQRLNSTFLLEGGYVEHQGYKPVALRVPANMESSKLDLSQFKGLGTITLAGTKLAESTLNEIGKMDSLMDIDVSQTALDDSDLMRLVRTTGFVRLSLAGTQVTVQGINHAMSSCRITTLDIGYLGLDDDSVEKLRIQDVLRLILRGNPITDKSLAYLTTLSYLDLSGTHCDGSEFGLLRNVKSLLLDETSVNDAAIANLLASNSVLTRLSLRNTRVTDATLIALQKYQLLMELELGDGEITAKGLESAVLTPSDRLALNSRKFTGSIFQSWKPTIRRLDMSRSGVTDADVYLLASVGGLQELSLAHCDVSDASVEKLVAMNLMKIDLTGTKITSAMAAKLFPLPTEVYVSPSQCSPEELDRPYPQSALRIGLRYDAQKF